MEQCGIRESKNLGGLTVMDNFVTRVATLAFGGALIYYYVLPVLHQIQTNVIQAIALLGGGR